MTGISNPPASGTGTINETLINTTANPIGVTYVYTMSTPECLNPLSVNIVVVVIPAPTVTASASKTPVCPGEQFDLSSFSNIGPSMPPTLLSENFNTGLVGGTSGPNGWTTTTTGILLRRWILRPSPYTNGSNTTINSGDAIFYYAESVGGNTTTTLISPSINTIGYTSLTLNFRHYFRWRNSSDYAYVDISRDNGVTTETKNYLAANRNCHAKY